MKRDKYDTAVSDLVRERAHWTCERSGLIDVNGQATGKSRGMHASHFNTRGSGNIARYDMDNVRCLCATEHGKLEGRPGMHTAFLRELLGDTRFEEMERRCNRVYKWEYGEKEEMYQHYKSELARVKEMRRDGVMGYIEVVNWF